MELKMKEKMAMKHQFDKKESHSETVDYHFNWRQSFPGKISKEINRGSYATVFKGRTSDKTHCAIKKPHPHILSYEESLESYKTEIKMHSTLDHPSIVKFYGIFSVENHLPPLLIMERMWESLYSFIEQKLLSDFSLLLQLHIVRDVTEGLAYLHSQNIIHRDLTLSNILLTRELDAKISDFGGAQQLDVTKCSSRCSVPGNHLYMPPESLASNPVCGPKLDIFSLGCNILCIINKTVPGPGDKFSKVHIAERYLNRMPSECPLLKELAASCLAYEPKDRPDIACVLAVLNVIISSICIAPAKEQNTQTQCASGAKKDAINFAQIASRSRLKKIKEQTNSEVLKVHEILVSNRRIIDFLKYSTPESTADQSMWLRNLTTKFDHALINANLTYLETCSLYFLSSSFGYFFTKSVTRLPARLNPTSNCCKDTATSTTTHTLVSNSYFVKVSESSLQQTKQNGTIEVSLNRKQTFIVVNVTQTESSTACTVPNVFNVFLLNSNSKCLSKENEVSPSKTEHCHLQTLPRHMESILPYIQQQSFFQELLLEKVGEASFTSRHEKPSLGTLTNYTKSLSSCSYMPVSHLWPIPNYKYLGKPSVFVKKHLFLSASNATQYQSSNKFFSGCIDIFTSSFAIVAKTKFAIHTEASPMFPCNEASLFRYYGFCTVLAIQSSDALYLCCKLYIYYYANAQLTIVCYTITKCANKLACIAIAAVYNGCISADCAQKMVWPASYIACTLYDQAVSIIRLQEMSAEKPSALYEKSQASIQQDRSVVMQSAIHLETHWIHKLMSIYLSSLLALCTSFGKESCYFALDHQSSFTNACADYFLEVRIDAVVMKTELYARQKPPTVTVKPFQTGSALCMQQEILFSQSYSEVLSNVEVTSTSPCSAMFNISHSTQKLVNFQTKAKQHSLLMSTSKVEFTSYAKPKDLHKPVYTALQTLSICQCKDHIFEKVQPLDCCDKPMMISCLSKSNPQLMTSHLTSGYFVAMQKSSIIVNQYGIATVNVESSDSMQTFSVNHNGQLHIEASTQATSKQLASSAIEGHNKVLMIDDENFHNESSIQCLDHANMFMQLFAVLRKCRHLFTQHLEVRFWLQYNLYLCNLKASDIIKFTGHLLYTAFDCQISARINFHFIQWKQCTSICEILQQKRYGPSELPEMPRKNQLEAHSCVNGHVQLAVLCSSDNLLVADSQAFVSTKSSISIAVDDYLCLSNNNIRKHQQNHCTTVGNEENDMLYAIEELSLSHQDEWLLNRTIVSLISNNQPTISSNNFAEKHTFQLPELLTIKTVKLFIVLLNQFQHNYYHPQLLKSYFKSFCWHRFLRCAQVYSCIKYALHQHVCNNTQLECKNENQLLHVTGLFGIVNIALDGSQISQHAPEYLWAKLNIHVLQNGLAPVFATVQLNPMDYMNDKACELLIKTQFRKAYLQRWISAGIILNDQVADNSMPCGDGLRNVTVQCAGNDGIKETMNANKNSWSLSVTANNDITESDALKKNEFKKVCKPAKHFVENEEQPMNATKIAITEVPRQHDEILFISHKEQLLNFINDFDTHKSSVLFFLPLYQNEHLLKSTIKCEADFNKPPSIQNLDNSVLCQEILKMGNHNADFYYEIMLCTSSHLFKCPECNCLLAQFVQVISDHYSFQNSYRSCCYNRLLQAFIMLNINDHTDWIVGIYYNCKITAASRAFEVMQCMPCIHYSSCEQIVDTGEVQQIHGRQITCCHELVNGASQNENHNQVVKFIIPCLKDLQSLDLLSRYDSQLTMLMKESATGNDRFCRFLHQHCNVMKDFAIGKGKMLDTMKQPSTMQQLLKPTLFTELLNKQPMTSLGNGDEKQSTIFAFLKSIGIHFIVNNKRTINRIGSSQLYHMHWHVLHIETSGVITNLSCIQHGFQHLCHDNVQLLAAHKQTHSKQLLYTTDFCTDHLVVNSSIEEHVGTSELICNLQDFYKMPHLCMQTICDVLLIQCNSITTEWIGEICHNMYGLNLEAPLELTNSNIKTLAFLQDNFHLYKGKWTSFPSSMQSTNSLPLRYIQVANCESYQLQICNIGCSESLSKQCCTSVQKSNNKESHGDSGQNSDKSTNGKCDINKVEHSKDSSTCLQCVENCGDEGNNDENDGRGNDRDKDLSQINFGPFHLLFLQLLLLLSNILAILQLVWLSVRYHTFNNVHLVNNCQTNKLQNRSNKRRPQLIKVVWMGRNISHSTLKLKPRFNYKFRAIVKFFQGTLYLHNKSNQSYTVIHCKLLKHSDRLQLQVWRSTMYYHASITCIDPDEKLFVVIQREQELTLLQQWLTVILLNDRDFELRIASHCTINLQAENAINEFHNLTGDLVLSRILFSRMYRRIFHNRNNIPKHFILEMQPLVMRWLSNFRLYESRHSVSDCVHNGRCLYNDLAVEHVMPLRNISGSTNGHTDGCCIQESAVDTSGSQSTLVYSTHTIQTPATENRADVFRPMNNIPINNMVSGRTINYYSSQDTEGDENTWQLVYGRLTLYDASGNQRIPHHFDEHGMMYGNAIANFAVGEPDNIFIGPEEEPYHDHDILINAVEENEEVFVHDSSNTYLRMVKPFLALLGTGGNTDTDYLPTRTSDKHLPYSVQAVEGCNDRAVLVCRGLEFQVPDEELNLDHQYTACEVTDNEDSQISYQSSVHEMIEEESDFSFQTFIFELIEDDELNDDSQSNTYEIIAEEQLQFREDLEGAEGGPDN